MLFFYENADLLLSQRMNSSMPLYALGGAIIFCTMSVLATKYRGEEFKPKHLIRDSTAGALFTAFILTLVPDMFPPINGIASISAVATAASAAMKTVSGSGTSDTSDFDDFELQVGYPKRR